MIDIQQLDKLIAAGESVQREFKSDRRQISDSEIYEELVALANTEGGVLLIGVEDEGAVTGANPRHGRTTDPFKLQAAIFNNTVPSVNTRISLVKHPQGAVLAIEVDTYPEPCATAAGKSVRRVVGPDGKPQTVPFYPRDQRSRRVALGLLDFSAQVMDMTSFEDLDPLAFERMRQTIVRLRGDRGLLELDEKEMVKALRLVETQGGRLIPNLAGLLLLGREEVLRDVVPTHEVFFQVLDGQGNVKVNDVFYGPLIGVREELENRLIVRNEEREVTVGLFRIPVPDYSPEGFREAVNNAVLHRDYTRREAVYVQWQSDHLLITSPGGFPEGITVDNILVHEPKPRNPRLAEAFRRVGLVEQTGRGVDKIYMGQLRYGRPAPDYLRSDTTGVRVVLRGGAPSLQFAAFVYEQDKEGSPLGLDEMLLLNTLFFERRIDSQQAGDIVQRGQVEGRGVLETLVERGLVEAKGETKGRTYHLSAGLYRALGQPAGYVRQRGISSIRHEAMVLEFLKAHGRIERKHVMELCGLSGPQAGRLLKKMERTGRLKRQGTPPRWTYYVFVK